MKRLLVCIGLLALGACDPNAQPTSVGSTPVIGTACAQLTIERMDTALKAYDAAADAVNLLIDAKVIKPGSPSALKAADANDAILAGFRTAEAARLACNATSYSAALVQITAGLAQLRSAIHGG